MRWWRGMTNDKKVREYDGRRKGGKGDGGNVGGVKWAK